MTRRLRPLRRMLIVSGLASLALSVAPARAQVFQLEADGAVLVRQGSGAVQWQRTDAPATPTVAALAPALPAASPSPMLIAAPVPTAGSTLLHQAAAQAGVHPALLEALVWQESRWHPGAVSPKGAVGLTQLMPATARDLGVDPRDPAANLYGGARYLRSMLDRFDGNLVKALAAYNAGPRRVEQAGGIPPIRETQNYVASILGRLGRTLARR